MNNCPFCNSNKLKYYEEESGFYITCLGCDITAPTFKNPDKSIAAWNTRPIEAELRKDYANLKEQFQVTLQAHNDLEEELEQKEKIEAELRARVKELETFKTETTRILEYANNAWGASDIGWRKCIEHLLGDLIKGEL